MNKLEYYLHLFGYVNAPDTDENKAIYEKSGLNKFEFYDFKGEAK